MRVMKLLGNQKGMTLIELLAVVTIMSAIIMAISSVQLQFLTTHKEIQEGSFQNDETSFFIQTLTNQVRKAEKISVTNNRISIKQGPDTVEFVYNPADKTVAYIKGAQNMELLKNVEQFQPSIPTPADREGIELLIKVKTGDQIEEFTVKAFSFIGTKG